MAMHHEIRSLLEASLEDVLVRLYSVTTLRWLYDVSLHALAESHAERLPVPPRAPGSNPGKAPRKADLVVLLLAVLRDKEMGRRFWESLPRPTRDLVAALTWERQASLEALEKSLGCPIAMVNPDQRRRHYEPFLLPPEFGLVALFRSMESAWGYYPHHNQPRKEDYLVVLPDTVRRVFKQIVPPPIGYDLIPLDGEPASTGKHYCPAQSALPDLHMVAELIAQGQLQYTKSERLTLSSLKKLRQVTDGAEFFEDAGDRDLALLRIRLLAGGTAFAGKKQWEQLLARPDSAEPVRALFQSVSQNACFLHEELLPHLSNRHNEWHDHHEPSTKQLAAFFGKLPPGRWVTWENIRSYHRLREQMPTLFGADTRGLLARVTTQGDAWSDTAHVSELNAFELVGEPLLKGFAFLLAAFGLAEIVYDVPRHPTYRRPGKENLTPYDGLRHVRLTPLGEFALGRRKSFETAAALPARPPVILDESRLLVTCREPDKLTELALGQFMESLAPGRYQMTPKSFLNGCHSRQDIEARIHQFRRAISPTPPANWEAFFERTLNRVAPLAFEPDYVVLKVGADEEFRSLLASDPILRETILKVEGLRIAVRQGDLKKLVKRLAQLGHLSPIA